MTRAKPHSCLPVVGPAVIGLAILAALAVLSWRIDQRVAAPPVAAADTPRDAAPPATTRPLLPEHVAAPDVAGGLPRDPDTVDTCRAERHAAPATLPLVRARDATTLADVPRATSRLEARRDDGARTIVVEAIGYHPTRRPYDDADAGTAAERSIDVLLEPEGRPPGIALLARDPGGAPVEHLCVEAFVVLRAPQSVPSRRSLWSRYTRAADGRHELPGVPAGEVELRISATDAQHRPLPLCTERRTFYVDGSAGIADAVAFVPGAAPWLEFVRADGRSRDPERDGPLTLSLRAPDGSTRPTQWLQAFGNGTRGAEDAVLGLGPAWPSESLAPGSYLLSISVRSELRVQRPLHLIAGRVHRERIAVP